MIMKELQKIIKTQGTVDVKTRGWTVMLGEIDNLYRWKLQLSHFDASLPLAKDVASRKLPGIQMFFS
jgi:hypothetical protein